VTSITVSGCLNNNQAEKSALAALAVNPKVGDRSLHCQQWCGRFILRKEYF